MSLELARVEEALRVGRRERLLFSERDGEAGKSRVCVELTKSKKRYGDHPSVYKESRESRGSRGRRGSRGSGESHVGLAARIFHCSRELDIEEKKEGVTPAWRTST